MNRPHDLDHGADCWCEPRIELVTDAEGETHRVFVHACDVCGRNPCRCAKNRPKGDA